MRKAFNKNDATTTQGSQQKSATQPPQQALKFTNV
jgi:hypothetical protein